MSFRQVRRRFYAVLFFMLASLCLPLSTAPAGAAATTTIGIDLPAADEGLPGAGPIRRDPWFQTLWTQRRSQWATRIQADQGALVFLGDSITQGWERTLAETFPGVKIANRGISGDTTRGMLIRLQADVLALNPKGVVMLMGTNDLEDQASPETIAGNVRLILDACKRHDAALPIVLCQVFPSSDKKRRPAEKIRRLNRLCAAMVKTEPRVTVLDTWTLFAGPNGDAKPEEFPDLLHPNQAGYAKWAAALRPILATLGFMELDTEAFTPEPGFRSLFNGHDLSGWGLRPTSPQDLESRANWRRADPNAPPWPVITAPVSFDGLKESPDGRFLARNGRLIVSTPSEGRRIQQIWTSEAFPDDFVLKLEFRATPNADSGIYLRGPQLQCRDYLLAGPYRNLTQYRPQEWNEIVVTVKGDVAHCTCNGEVLEAAFALPATGPIGLEGDRGQMEYRHIRIKRAP